MPTDKLRFDPRATARAPLLQRTAPTQSASIAEFFTLKGSGQALADSLTLRTSVGQGMLFVGRSAAYDVPVLPTARRVAPDYNPYRDENLGPYRRHLDAFKNVTSPEEFRMVAAGIDINEDLRNGLADYPVTDFLSGFLDPINLLPVPLAYGKGFLTAMKRAMPAAAGIVTATELARTRLDPTDTATETLFNVVGGTLMAGLFAGAAGHWGGKVGPKVDADLLRKTLDTLLPPDMVSPPGQANMGFPLPPWMSPTHLLRKANAMWQNKTIHGDPLSDMWDKLAIRQIDEADNDIGSTIFVELADELDEPVIRASIEGTEVKVDWTSLPTEMQGKGIATAAYKQLIRWADEKGYTLSSDVVVTKDAQRIWKRLEDEGYNIVYNDKAELWADGRLVGEQPVYRVAKQSEREVVPAWLRNNLRDYEVRLRTGEHMEAELIKQRDEWAAKHEKRSIAGGAKTKAKQALDAVEKNLKEVSRANDEIRSRAADTRVLMEDMIQAEADADHVMVSRLYGVTANRQFPFFHLSMNKFRAKKAYAELKRVGHRAQYFAMGTAQLPGVQTLGNRMSHAAGVSVEAASKVHWGAPIAAKKHLNQVYAEYLGLGENTGNITSFTVDLRQRVRSVVDRGMGKERSPVTSDGKMTLRAFEKEVSIAMLNGGTHSNEYVARAVKPYWDWLQKISEDGQKLNVFAARQVLVRKQERIQEKLDNLLKEMKQDAIKGKIDIDKKYKKKWLEEDLYMVEKQIESYDSAEAFIPGQKGWMHRAWRAHMVRAKEAELKQLIREYFEAETRNMRQAPHRFFDKETGELLEKIAANDPGAITARVNESYASILREAEAGEIDMRTTDKRLWLEARRKWVEENTPAGNEKKVQLQIIDEKINGLIQGLDTVTTGSGPLLARKLNLDNAELMKLGVIEDEISVWSAHYVSRIAPQIEMARRWGDPTATEWIGNWYEEAKEAIAKVKNIDAKERQALVDEAAGLRDSMRDLADITLGVYQVPTNPASLTNRTLRLLRNWNVLGAMGRSTLMALGDTGNIVISQGFARSFGHLFDRMSANLKGGNSLVRMIDHEVELAGLSAEVINGMRFHQLTDAGPAYGDVTGFERGVGEAVQRFFVYNMMAPWTDMARKWAGGMVQSEILRMSIDWRAGKLAKEDVARITKLGVNREQAIQFVEEWERAGSLKWKEKMFVANTENWTSESAKRAFRAAMVTEVDRAVPTPGAADKPTILLRSEWGKIIGQYRGFAMGATHRIMAAGLQEQGAQKYIGALSMVAIVWLVDLHKRQDYIDLSVGEQLLRAVELSGVTGIILDLNDTIERASAGSVGLRPLLGMDIRERDPNWANRLGTIGAVPNSLLTALYAFSSDDATTHDQVRALRYMTPYNNLLWFNEFNNRVQRSVTDTLEDWQ